MSKNMCKMSGIVMMIISVFFLIAGLYFPQAGIAKMILDAVKYLKKRDIRCSRSTKRRYIYYYPHM
ncbi:MAG: hypothetical protein K5686_02225 [Lachnospiraceae bacterium]|nr:hypothetical protein [Lachnospiraceae bacterium]